MNFSLKRVTDDFLAEVSSSMDVKRALAENLEIQQSFFILVDSIKRALESGNKVILFGNGGSAADSQHIAAEFVSRFRFNRPALPAIALTVDTSALTAIGNDYGFDQVFSRQLEAVGSKGDVAIGITTSGKSPNVLLALEKCIDLEIKPFAFTGENGVLSDKLNDVVSLRVPSVSTARIQECHILIGHIMCGVIEETFFG